MLTKNNMLRRYATTFEGFVWGSTFDGKVGNDVTTNHLNDMVYYASILYNTFETRAKRKITRSNLCG